ncbi:MAG: metallophosphoesterase family protein [Oscillospiraceae bacterium]|nr:metallophosphoesterase family protein [Oscillospiraceae bacterium]
MKRRRFWVLAVIVLALMAKSCFLCTNEYRCGVSRLPAAFAGLRIAVLSDLHGAQFGRDNAALLRATRSAAPDLIALTGDLCGQALAPADLLTLARGLQAIAPTYYVTGNHEWASGFVQQTENVLKTCGVTVLSGSFVQLRRGSERLVLAGLDDPNGPYDGKTAAQLMAEIRADAPSAPVVMLYHRNDRLAQWASLGTALVLCGHSHGGVVRVPGLGGLFGPGGRRFPAYDAGVYRQANTTMLVSRGLGNGGIVPRLGNPPEIAIAVLCADS